MSHIDSTRLTAEEMPEPMQQRARLTVCRNAASATEAQEFMAMLGIIDGPDTPKRKPGTCPACGKDLPIEAHSSKWGTAGYCSRKCRNAGQSKTAPPQTCVECREPMAYKAEPESGQRRTGAHGMCDLCYSRARANGSAPRAEFVSPAKAAAYLEKMRDLGVPWKVLEEATELARSSLNDIMRGKIRQIRPETERAILAVEGLGEAVPA